MSLVRRLATNKHTAASAMPGKLAHLIHNRMRSEGGTPNYEIVPTATQARMIDQPKLQEEAEAT